MQRARPSSRSLVAAFAAVALAAALPAGATAAPVLLRPDTAWATPAVAGHRGYSKLAPENTLASARLAMAAGADFVEGDTQPSADGVPYVLHDPTLSRTTDGFGLIATTSAAALDRLDAGSWFGSGYAGERLPRLTALLDTVRDGPSDLVIELKGAHTRPQVARVVEEIRAHGMAQRTVIQSFEEQGLRDAHELAPEIPLALLSNTVPADPVAAVRAVGAVAYFPDWSALKARPQAIAALASAGIAVVPFTVDDPNEWAAMRALGIDGVITNDPGGLVAWNAAYRREHPVPEDATPADESPADAGSPRPDTGSGPTPGSAPADTAPAAAPARPSSAPGEGRPAADVRRPAVSRARCTVRGARRRQRVRCTVPAWPAGSTVRLTRGGRTYARGRLGRLEVLRPLTRGSYRLRRGTRTLAVTVSFA